MAIPEAAVKGEGALRRKAATMASSWQAAKTRMKAGYAAFGFGPARTAAFNAGIDAATYKAPDPGKWSRNWSVKMAE